MIGKDTSRTTWLAALAVTWAACGASTISDDRFDAPPADAPLPLTGDARGADGGTSAGCLPGLDSLTLSPPSTEVTGAPPATIPYTATAHYSGGRTETVPGDRLSWTASRTDDTPAGTVSAGTFVPYAAAGGTITITASDGCKSGSATVTLVLVDTVGTPPVGDVWGAPPTTQGAPALVYPSDGTRFPRNIYRTLFQWRTAGFSEFRLRFAGAGSDVTVYTDGAHALCADKAPAAGGWEADEAAWNAIAASNAGGTVTLTLDALDRSTATPTVRRAAPITIGFSRRDVRGAIFYWSTTAKGVRRANVAASAPENYLTGAPSTVYPDDRVKCVACHVVSRDGQFLAGATDAESGKGLWITAVTVEAPPDPLVREVAGTGGHGFATFSPDNSRMVAAWGDKTWLLDRASGAFIANVPTGGAATHPDWSPDNSRLVFATGKGDNPTGASIKVLPYLGGTSWGTATTLVAAGGQSNLFPMFSADGKWVAYARGKGGSHGDATLQLHVVSGAGGTPVELRAANRVVSNHEGDGQHQNSQPTWAPTGDFYWIAFNSHREYGVVRPEGTQQIWVAAIDPARLAAGGADPSFPAFRLQFQGLDEDNHRAFWTEDVRYPDPPPPGPSLDAGVCVPHLAACDPGGASPCCDKNDRCDTRNDGETYECRLPFLE